MAHVAGACGIVVGAHQGSGFHTIRTLTLAALETAAAALPLPLADTLHVSTFHHPRGNCADALHAPGVRPQEGRGAMSAVQLSRGAPVNVVACGLRARPPHCITYGTAQ